MFVLQTQIISVLHNSVLLSAEKFLKTLLFLISVSSR